MPLHRQLQVMLDKVAGLPPMHTLSVQAVRATDLARYASVPKVDVGPIEDRVIAGPRGPLRVRFYRPDTGNGHPVVVFFHGSGFVICSIETHDAMCRQICSQTGMIVASVDYALAPESKFPAAPDDCLAATRWVAEHAVEFGGDPGRLALAGDSAGANLAAVTALRLRDEGGGADVKAQLLMYPVADYHTPATPSYQERAVGFGLTRDAMRWFWAHYLNNEDEGRHPHASPLRAQSFERLPAAYVITAEYDPLRDEGELLAARLRAAGVPVEQIRYGDMNHGFMNWTGLIDRSDEAMAAACAWLKRTL